MKKMDYKEYYDKVLGGWIGKCAGGVLGAPIEGYKRFHTIEYSDELFATNFANDDLDLQVLWLDMLLKKGNKVRESDFKQHWLQHVEFPWCEYGIAAKNMRIGLDIPNSGNHNNWYWQHGMGSPIRSEIWGMVHPGLPEKAIFYAGIDSRLDHAGFSVHAEQYLSACEALAFFENDIKTILTNGLDYIPKNSDCAKMIRQVITWQEQYEFKIVAGKIKSRYGDADFTSAPMNIAFTLLALLHANNSFDFLINVLNLGHDSDCVVATAGSLLGTVLGYTAIPKVWKQRVGNELLISPEVSGIYCPKTITELAELTCKVGVHCVQENDLVTITDYPQEILVPTIQKMYELSAEVLEYPNYRSKQKGNFYLHYENLTDQAQRIKIKVDSPFFETSNFSGTVPPFSNKKLLCNLEFKMLYMERPLSKLGYEVKLTIDDKQTVVLEKGIPFYGSWMLLGPFIEDDMSLKKSNEKYPDHGLSSLPSVIYMNHDKSRPKTRFMDTDKLEGLLKNNALLHQPFQAEIIYPQSMKIDLADYFHGLGERTIYVYSEIESNQEITKWLCIGSTAYVEVCLNNTEVYKNDAIKRRWPMAHACELKLNKGVNKLLIRLDIINDDFAFEVGLKEHGDKHYHQNHWENQLQFNAPKLR